MNFRQVLHWIGITLGAVLLIWQILKSVRFLQLGEVSLQAPVFLVGSVIITLIAFGIQIFAWTRIMLRLGFKISPTQAIAGYSLSFLPRYIPGSIWGYLSRNEWLRCSYGVDARVATLGSVLEVAFILLVGSVAASVYLAIVENSLKGWLAVGLIGISTWLITWLTFRILDHSFVREWVGQSVKVIKPDRRSDVLDTLMFIIQYLVLWSCHGLSLMLSAASLGFHFHLDFSGFMFSFVIAWSIGFLILFVPSGMGIREVVLASMLTAALGISNNAAVIISVFGRLVTLMGETLWIIFVLMKRLRGCLGIRVDSF